MFLIAQLFGIFSTVAAILCVQASTAGGVLVGQILANGCSGISYGLLGSLSGAWVCVLAAVHSVLISFTRKYDALRRKKWILLISVIFAAAYVVGSAVTYTRWPDAICCVWALLFVLTIAQEDASKMRNVMLVSMSLWVIFDISVGAYTNIITHAYTIVSILAAKVRLDRK
jgi:hypothetical protein